MLKIIYLSIITFALIGCGGGGGSSTTGSSNPKVTVETDNSSSSTSLKNFSYATQRDVKIALKSSSELANKQVLLFLSKKNIQTIVGELEVLDCKLVSTVFNSKGELNYTHTVGNHIDSLWIVVPFYSIETNVQITNNTVELTLNNGGVL